jgi:acetyltransferase-like isoleucine patch superfamily enzyme
MSKVGTLLSILVDPGFYAFAIRKGTRWLRGLVGEYAGLRQGRIVLGKHAYVHPSVVMQAGPGECIQVGDYSSVNAHTLLMGDVCIERYCLLSVNIYISSGDHYAQLFPPWIIRNQDEFVGADPGLRARHSHPVHIEEDVWIGWGVFIRKGVYIGRGAVIGAGTVVTRDVPPYSIQVGAPNREVRQRLAFQPPRCVVAADESHWPYFYAGFLFRPEHLKFSRPRGSLLATEKTRVLLAGGNFQALRLKGRLNPGTSKVSLKISCNQAPLGEATLDAEQFDCTIPAPASSQAPTSGQCIPSVLQGYNEIEMRVLAVASDRRVSSGVFAHTKTSHGIASLELV